MHREVSRFVSFISYISLSNFLCSKMDVTKEKSSQLDDEKKVKERDTSWFDHWSIGVAFMHIGGSGLDIKYCQVDFSPQCVFPDSTQ